MVIPDVLEFGEVGFGQHLRLGIFHLETPLLRRRELGLRIRILTTGAFIKPFGLALRSLAGRRPDAP
jgi:hypothetical protein